MEEQQKRRVDGKALSTYSIIRLKLEAGAKLSDFSPLDLITFGRVSASMDLDSDSELAELLKDQIDSGGISDATRAYIEARTVNGTYGEGKVIAFKGKDLFKN